jgi:Homeodomain-like domain
MSVMDSVREQIDARLKELEPLAEEYERLRRIVALLDSEPDAEAAITAARATPRRSMRSAVTTRGTRSRRAEEALRLVTERPGITVAEAAEAMGIGTTYLYRLLPRLEREGRVRKDGRGYRPA